MQELGQNTDNLVWSLFQLMFCLLYVCWNSRSRELHFTSPHRCWKINFKKTTGLNLNSPVQINIIIVGFCLFCKNSLTWAILVSIGIKRKQPLQTLLELHNFYKLNVSYVTQSTSSEVIIIQLQINLNSKIQLYGLGTNEIDWHIHIIDWHMHMHKTTRIC